MIAGTAARLSRIATPSASRPRAPRGALVVDADSPAADSIAKCASMIFSAPFSGDLLRGV